MGAPRAPSIILQGVPKLKAEAASTHACAHAAVQSNLLRFDVAGSIDDLTRNA